MIIRATLSMLVILLVATTAPVLAEKEPALVISPGSVAQRQVVALGRDLVIDGQAASDVAAVNGSVRVTGQVEGDVIVLGGGVELGSTARVRGDVFVLGGSIEAASGASIGGRSVSYPNVSAAWIVLLEGPALGQSSSSAVVIGAKLALLAAWLGWSLVLFATNGRGVLSISEAVSRHPIRNFFVGLSGVLASFLTALFFSAFAAILVGVPLLALVVLLALLLKLWGMVAVFHAAGGALTRRFSQRRWIPLNAAVVGLGLLGLVKLLPWVGTWAWTVASLIGVGAALTTKFGRREPWFEVAAVPSRLA